MNDDDLEQVWKELIVVCFEVISCYFFEYTKNITETQSKHQVSRPRSKIRTSKVEAVVAVETTRKGGRNSSEWNV
jgi:hypothetical protein